MTTGRNRLINTLLKPTSYDHPVGEIELIETHISWIILTGRYAYKIKKPLDLGFLDFSTLDLRRRYCRRELELNRRLAPELYLAVIRISGSADRPRLSIDGEEDGEPGDALEYAVKMAQFPQSAQLDRRLAEKNLHPEHIDQLAAGMAEFHQRAEVAAEADDFGCPPTILAAALENFEQTTAHTDDAPTRTRLQTLRRWTEQQFGQLEALMSERKAAGFVRNCHGDMHLANMALIDGKVVIFDCIEFKDEFRWLDTVSELAFTLMDLQKRGRADYAARLLNRYLELSGDYGGITLLRFYLVYRAMVRCKVAMIQRDQTESGSERYKQLDQQAQDYLALAESHTRPRQPRLLIAHGLSGSGKTSVSTPLLEAEGLIRIRSDVERKRLFGLQAHEKSDSTTEGGIYTRQASEQTYQHLARLSETVLAAGFGVIVDATFLKRAERQRFKELARKVAVPFIILHFHAPIEQLKIWIEERNKLGRDASEATVDVLEKQIADEEPLTADEADMIIDTDTLDPQAAEQLINRYRALDI